MPPCQLSPYNIMKNKEEEREWTMYNGRCVNPSWAKCSARGFYKSNQLTFAPFYYLYLNLPYKWRSIFSGVLHQHWSPSRCSLLDEQKKENKKSLLDRCVVVAAKVMAPGRCHRRRETTTGTATTCCPATSPSHSASIFGMALPLLWRLS